MIYQKIVYSGRSKVIKTFDEDILYYKVIISYNTEWIAYLKEEWIYNQDGTILYQKEVIPHFSCFGRLSV